MNKNQYNIAGLDFTRNDGLVSVKVRPKVESLEKKDNAPFVKPSRLTDPISYKDQSKSKKNQYLIKCKYRCLKTDILSLKRLLKRPYNVREFKEFYRIYGPKLIEIDFGNIELFNVKGQNQYSIQEIQQYNKGQNILRWGMLFSIFQLQKYNEGQSIQNQIVALQFYNMLVRERIFTLRTLRYYKDDNKRKQFPYQYLYTYDFEDCLEFNIQSFQEQASGQIKAQNNWLPLLKYKFFQKEYNNCQFENIIVPFFQAEQNQIQLFFAHFNKNGYKISEKNIVKVEQGEKEKDKYSQCYIFVNFDATFYSQSQLLNGVQEFARIHNFELSSDDVQYINIKRKSILEDYVDYIETEFFQQEKSQSQEKMNYIFNELPKEISQKRFNDILNDKFIIPQNIESVMEQFFGK